MNLNIYLTSKGLTDQAFADMIECERSFANRLRHGEVYPKYPTVVRIEKATQGHVTAVDLFEAHRAKRASKARRKG